MTLIRLIDPLIMPWVALRVLVRILVGRHKRNNIFTQVGWGRPDSFWLSLGFPKHLIRSWLIKTLHQSVVEATHEPKVSTFLLNKFGELFVDVGANHGYFSFLLYRNFKRLIAVEPHPENLDIIKAVKQVYNYPRVETLPIALNSHNGEVNLYIGSHSGGHSIFRYGRFIKTGEFIKVPAKTLTSIIVDNDVDVDLIKVDVEGAEWRVLEGTNSVMDRIQSWLIELHDVARKHDLEDFFEALGYNHRWINRNHFYAFRR